MRTSIIYLAILASLSLPAHPAFPLTLTFSSDNAQVSEVSPGAEIALLYVARRIEDQASVVVHGTELVIDADRDGVVELTVKPAISPTSVWIAVDLSSGELVWAAPEGFEPPPLTFEGGEPPLGSARELRINARQLRAVLVRAGAGVWQAGVGDGAEGDEDAEVDGVVVVAVGRMEPVGVSAQAPEELAMGDRLVLVDPATLAVLEFSL